MSRALHAELLFSLVQYASACAKSPIELSALMLDYAPRNLYYELRTEKSHDIFILSYITNVALKWLAVSANHL